MEGEQSYGHVPDLLEPEEEARAVQFMAEELSEDGLTSEPEAAGYDAAIHELEQLRGHDSELADEIVSASLAEARFRNQIGSLRFELFKEAQKDALESATNEARLLYRTSFGSEDANPEQREDRLRRESAEITRDLYAKFIRQVAFDERTKKACNKDIELVKAALGTFDARLNLLLTRVIDDELEMFYRANKRQ